jgi:hydroxymethylpyrimidine/phosphomethylpyrimidine kinase
VLLVAGLEPSGRAGLLADVETVRALKAASLAVASALTAQGLRTFATSAAPASVVRRQLDALLELGPLDAVKLGMVPDARVLGAVVRGLAGVRAPWVVDPVVRSSKGERLSSLAPRDYLRLAGDRVVLTPNLVEAAWLLGWRRPVDSPERAAQAAAQLLEQGFGAVVLKGGHSAGAAVDVVATRQGVALLSGARLPRGALSHRGTGCRFATALAVGLANGEGPVAAARAAKAFVRRFLRSAILPAVAQGRFQ